MFDSTCCPGKVRQKPRNPAWRVTRRMPFLVTRAASRKTFGGHMQRAGAAAPAKA